MNRPAPDMLATTLVVVEIAERLREAARINRRLVARGTAPARIRAAWPDVVRAAAEAYARSEAATREAGPSSAEITRMDEALGWLLWIDGAERRLVWARACGVPWRSLEIRDQRGLKERMLRNYWHDALEEIARRLSMGRAA